ncbi:MAG: glucose PTS transporter subunit IIA, partial [Anaerovoracaceae bacterium]
IEAGMLAEKDGLNIWMPIASAANFAQFGACLAVAVKTKSAKTRDVAFPSSLSASLGITEPAIFGVNLRFMKPFVCGMVGGAAGAMFGSITGLGAKAYGVTGIPGLLTINHIPLYCIELAISGGIAFALTMFIWREEPQAVTKEQGEKDIEDALEADAEPENREMPVIIKCEAGDVKAPAYGQIIAQKDIPDETFAAGVLGEGVGIQPEVGVILAPFDGEISSVADSKHAIGVEGAGDMEVLIHVGVDTVKMNGKGFKPLVEEGDKVKAGQKIMEFDRDAIAEAGYPDTVVVLLTNSDDYDNVDVIAGDEPREMPAEEEKAEAPAPDEKSGDAAGEGSNEEDNDK